MGGLLFCAKGCEAPEVDGIRHFRFPVAQGVVIKHKGQQCFFRNTKAPLRVQSRPSAVEIRFRCRRWSSGVQYSLSAMLPAGMDYNSPGLRGTKD